MVRLKGKSSGMVEGNFKQMGGNFACWGKQLGRKKQSGWIMLIFKNVEKEWFCCENRNTEIWNLCGYLDPFRDMYKTRRNEILGRKREMGEQCVEWGRSCLKAKAEAWVLSRPRLPCVHGELTWNHWSCLKISVQQVLEALIQQNASASFKKRFNWKLVSFRMKWSTGMQALLEGMC